MIAWVVSLFGFHHYTLPFALSTLSPCQQSFSEDRPNLQQIVRVRPIIPHIKAIRRASIPILHLGLLLVVLQLTLPVVHIDVSPGTRSRKIIQRHCRRSVTAFKGGLHVMGYALATNKTEILAMQRLLEGQRV